MVRNFRFNPEFENQKYEAGLVHRVRRDAPPYGPPAPAPYHPAPHHGPKGRVGPVYTFVKTDPQVMRAGLGYKVHLKNKHASLKSGSF